MRSEKLSGLVASIGITLLLSSLASGCSDSNSGTEAKQDASIGNGGTGGSSNGGSGGSSGSGGSATGGTTRAGGAVGSGGAGSGGKTGSGGADAKSGGSTGTAGGSGAAATGGAKASGGVLSEGGANAGGATVQGGATGKGGAGTGTGSTGTGTSAATGGAAGGGGNTAATGGVAGCPELPAAPTGTTDAVAGTLIQFNDDGGWCWYQDERAVVDAKGKKLVIGSVGFKGSRNGNIEAVVYDLATGKASSPAKLGNISVDDHSAPAFNVRQDGKYLAVWAGHRVDCKSYYNIYDGTSWSAAKSFDWATKGCPWDSDRTHMITYSNVWYMSPTQMFDIARSVSTSQAILTSADDGTSWSFYGRMTYTQTVGYVAGYYKYWGNNTDRIDFLGTEAHPRDNDNSLYHGYLKDGKMYNSTGTVVDSSLTDTTGKDITAFTQVFKTGSSLGGVKLEHAWNHDLVRYDDGTVAFLGQARVSGTGTTDPDKRMIYGRFDGTAWKLTYIGKLGPKLYNDEQDYTGLGALHPDNPHIIYMSSTVNPADDKTSTSKHEIYQGITCDDGATWKWTPVTKGSTMDNLRPIVPKWDADHTALLWMRGTYTTAQNMTMKIVGTISGP